MRIYEKIKAHLERTSTATTVSRVIEAIIGMIMAGGFLLFFPACIVMFRRVERRLKTIIQEMSLRSDVGSVFLPYEFSAPASRTVDRSQVEMQVVEATVSEVGATELTRLGTAEPWSASVQRN